MVALCAVNAFALTEDYILYSRTEVAKYRKITIQEKSEKEKICEKFSLSLNIKESCLITKRSSQLLKACLSGTASLVSQSYCLIAENLSPNLVNSCYESTSSEQSEVACLVLANKKVVKNKEEIIGCAGLGAMEEITCLKFQK